MNVLRPISGSISGPMSGPMSGAASPAGSPAAASAPGAARRSFLEVLGEGAAPPTATHPSAASPAAPQKAPGHPAPAMPGWRALATDALKAEKQIDGVLKAAASGKTFTPGQLLAMQTQVFRYSQTVEVLSRATDKLIGAVKQTLGTQV